MIRLKDQITAAEFFVEQARRHDEKAVDAYAEAYAEALKRADMGDVNTLYATEDGWADGPLAFALEIADSDDADTVFLYRDGGPCCLPFSFGAAVKYITDSSTPTRGALGFVRRLQFEDGTPVFEDGHEPAGLLLAVLREEGQV